jgi:hypothetical protein
LSTPSTDTTSVSKTVRVTTFSLALTVALSEPEMQENYYYFFAFFP